MKKGYLNVLVALSIILFWVSSPAIGADIELAKKSTLEAILKKGELRVGFEAGYMPFEMTDKKGRFVGFDIDMAKEMAKAKGEGLREYGDNEWHPCAEGIVQETAEEQFFGNRCERE